MKRFEGKTALVTGGTSGIGLATARRLMDEGAKVIVTGSREKSLDQARRALGDGVVAIRNDAGKPESAAELAREISKVASKLDAVFFNAGFGRFQPLDAVNAEEFDAHYAVNVRGPLLQAKALAPLLNEGSAIVLNTSVAHAKGFPNMAIYASTKGAVRTLTRVLARELAPRNIRVNAVSPGPIETNFFERTGWSEQAISEFGKNVAASVPLRRMGKPEEVAAVAAFLLSNDASYVTGAEYSVDGGMGEL